MESNPKFKKLCTQEHFVMRQHSDALLPNQFDHLTFVGREPILTALRREQPLLCFQNTLVKEIYSQMFMEKHIYEKNKKYMDKLESKSMYTFIDSYSEMFNGMISVDKYLVLANSSIFVDKYPVFILIDSEAQDMRIGKKQKKIEFYGLICIGFLTDISPYSEDELIDFEARCNISIPPIMRTYLLKNSTVQFDKKLFRFDLETIEDFTRIKYNKASKNLNNFKLLKQMSETTDEDEKNTLLEENNKFIDEMNNGFLYLGLINLSSIPHNDINYTKQKEELYALINFEEQRGIDFSCTIWKKTCINGNANKLCDLHVTNKTDEEIEVASSEINIEDPTRMMYSMKYVADIY